MADSPTQNAATQARIAGADLLAELQAATSPVSRQLPTPETVRETGAGARARVQQVAEDVYWAGHRQLEQAVAARGSQPSGADVEERIAVLKRQIGA